MAISTSEAQLFSELFDESITSTDLDTLLQIKYLNESLYRYCSVTHSLNNEIHPQANLSFVNSIHDKIKEEVTYHLDTSYKTLPLDTTVLNKTSSKKTSSILFFPKWIQWNEFKKHLSGISLAASVAVITFLSVQMILNEENASLLENKTTTIHQSSKSDSIDGWFESKEQKKLELFNDHFMTQARQSEQQSIAPFARTVRGQRLGTFRISKQQWELMLHHSSSQKASAPKKPSSLSSEH
jgi:hypothetical protein